MAIPRSKLTTARLGAAISQAATDSALAREAEAIAARLRETDLSKTLCAS